jgi:hypothetical protein
VSRPGNLLLAHLISRPINHLLNPVDSPQACPLAWWARRTREIPRRARLVAPGISRPRRGWIRAVPVPTAVTSLQRGPTAAWTAPIPSRPWSLGPFRA